MDGNNFNSDWNSRIGNSSFKPFVNQSQVIKSENSNNLEENLGHSFETGGASTSNILSIEDNSQNQMNISGRYIAQETVAEIGAGTLNNMSRGRGNDPSYKEVRTNSSDRIFANLYSPRHNQTIEGNGKDYVFDKSTKKGKCNVCRVELSSFEQACDHLVSKGHEKKRMAENQVTLNPMNVSSQALRSASRQNSVIEGIPQNKILMCELCNAPFSSPFNMEQHFRGEKHRKQLRKKEIADNAMRIQGEFQFDPEQTLRKELVVSNEAPIIFQRSRFNKDNSEQQTGAQSDFENSVNKGDEMRQNSTDIQDEAFPRPDHVLKNNLSISNDKSVIKEETYQPCDYESIYSDASSIIDNNRQPILSLPQDQLPRSVLTSQPIQSPVRSNMPPISVTNQTAVLKIENVSPERQKEMGYSFDGRRGFCEVCNVDLTSVQLAQQHLNGQQHSKKYAIWDSNPRRTPRSREHFDAEASNTMPQVNPSPQMENRGSQKSYYNFDGNKGYCHACKSDLSSKTQFKQHMEGKPHKRNVQRFEECEQGITYPLYCNVCDKPFTGQDSAKQHYISEKHKNRRDLTDPKVTQILETFDGGKKIMVKGTVWILCNFCNKRLNTIEQFHVHRISHPPGSHRGSPHFNPIRDSPSEMMGAVGGYQSPNFPLNSQRSSSEEQFAFQQMMDHLTIAVNPVVNTDFSPQPFVQRPNFDTPLNFPNVSNIGFPNLIPNLEKERSANVDNIHEGMTNIGLAHVVRGRGFMNLPSNSQTYAQSFRDDVESSSRNITRDSDEINSSGGNILAFGNFHRSSNSSGSNSYGNQSSSKCNNDRNNSTNSNGAARGENCSNTNSNESYSEDHNYASRLDCDDARGDQSLSNYTTRTPKSQTSKRGERGQRNILRLDADENDDEEDDDDYDDYDDEENNGVMNITQEKEKPTSQSEIKISKVVKGVKNYCEVCDKVMNSKKSWKEHMKGSQHRMTLASQKANNPRSRPPLVKDCFWQLEEDNRLQSITESFPRGYQAELTEKAMASDCVITLPTGTGKTLVSVLTMGMMLELNPSRPVIFIVDKVLLVIQQARYILTEFKDKKFKRTPVQNNGNNDETVQREINLAFVCRGLLCIQDIPLWKHDIIVTTADYCINLLNNGTIMWEDFSLAVFDEVHHCVKRHPYRKLIEDYHKAITVLTKRPKILGLTASPAGKSSADDTYNMLKSLLQCLGGAKMVCVSEDCLNELKTYQSNPRLQQFCDPITDQAKHFQANCIKYFLRCYNKLVPLSETLRMYVDVPCSYFLPIVNNPTEEEFDNLTMRLLKDSVPLSEIPTLIFEAKCMDNATVEEKTSFDCLRIHTFKILLHIADIPTGIGFEEIKKDFTDTVDNHELQEVKSLGLPCAEFYQQIQNYEAEGGGNELPMIQRLLQILQDPSYVDWKKGSKALVLVRQRRTAYLHARKLRRQDFVEANKLRVTHLVGHGKGTQNKGMDVKDQKKVIDHQKKFDIIVATSIAEEGIDLQELELVISMNPPSNVTALVQMRGRARKKDSHFIILCSNEEEKQKVELLQQQEDNMMNAAQRCMAEG